MIIIRENEYIQSKSVITNFKGPLTFVRYDRDIVISVDVSEVK